MDYNQKAVRIATNLTRVRAASRAHFASWISEASNQQTEFFRIVCDLSGIGLSEILLLVFHLTNLQHFKNLKWRPSAGIFLLF